VQRSLIPNAGQAAKGGNFMPIVGPAIVPHPPIIVPSVGRGREREVQNTVDAYRTAAQFGQCIAKATNELGRRAVFVSSGDISHKLREDGPYGFAPEGAGI